jgi:hypothetical protein
MTVEQVEKAAKKFAYEKTKDVTVSMLEVLTVKMLNQLLETAFMEGAVFIKRDGK